MSAQGKHQAAKFLLTDGASTGLQYVLLIAFIEWWQTSKILSSAMALTLLVFLIMSAIIILPLSATTSPTMKHGTNLP